MLKTGFFKGAIAASLLTVSPFAATTAQAEDTINCVFPFWFGFAPVMVADKLGYFAEDDLTVTWAFDTRIASTNSARNPSRTASVAIRAKTARVIPTRLIHVIVDTPPSDLRARRYRQAISHSKRENGLGAAATDHLSL